MVLGAQSQREVLRSRHRVLAAMRAQAREQGRYLGGRPPYGYRLVDAGPHPNRAHARWGRRLQRLEPDPATGPHVQWMFTQRLAGRSVAGIARELTERGVPCPSEVDPQRNRHRDGAAWTGRTVAVILSNPRYTGRQVWGRQQQAARRSGSRSHQSMSAGEWWAGLGQARTSRVGVRAGVHRRPACPCRPSDPGRPGPQLPALRAHPVRCLRASYGLALGARPRRLSVPSRTQQLPTTGCRRAEVRLRPRRPACTRVGRPAAAIANLLRQAGREPVVLRGGMGALNAPPPSTS
jgi:hypothetical protein